MIRGYQLMIMRLLLLQQYQSHDHESGGAAARGSRWAADQESERAAARGKAGR
jgi:hypothetical protein